MFKYYKSVWSVLRLLKQALSGEHEVLTSGSINKAIFMLAVPMMAEMIMESLFAVVDVYFVSKISVTAVAAVGLTESVSTLVYAVGIGLSMAATALVARRIGEQNTKRAADVAFQAIIMCGLLGVVMGVAGYFYAGDVLLLMGGEPDVVQEGLNFTRVLYAGSGSILFLFLINGIFRGAGDASIAMRSLWLANGLNLVLDPILIFGWGPMPAYGITGAAIATTLGRSIGVLYQMYYLFNGKSIILLGWHNMVIRIKTIWELTRLSVGGMGQILISSASWIFMVRIVSEFGSEALAGYTIAFRVVIFSLLPIWGMSNAAATLVGQNLGAGEPARAELSVWRTAYMGTILLALISVSFFAFAEQIMELFTQQPAVVADGARCLKIVALGYVFYGFSMIVGNAFNGAGDTSTPMYLSFISFWLFQIPVAYALAMCLNMQSTGVYIAITAAYSFHAVLAMVVFKRGKWKLTQV